MSELPENFGCICHIVGAFEMCPVHNKKPEPAQADATKRWTLHKSFPSEMYVECDRKGWCEYQIHVEVVPLAALEQAERERDGYKAELLKAVDEHEDDTRRIEQAEARLKEAVGLLAEHGLGCDLLEHGQPCRVCQWLSDHEGGA